MGKTTNTKHKNNGKSRSYHPKNTNRCDTVKDVKQPNNPLWYAKSQQLLSDVANIPFSNVLGTPLGWSNETKGMQREHGYVPGIMRVEYAHSLGCGQEATDAPTIAARYIYSFVRHANSGSANYEAPDLYLMIIAWHSANALLTSAKRAYGTMMHYLARNRYFAETVVRAMGYDYNSLKKNMASFRTAINLYAARLNSIKVPGDMPIGARWQQLAGEYYVDANSTKSQLYIPYCSDYLRYDGYGSETGTGLMPVQHSDAMDIEEFTQVMEYLLIPLTSEEDVGIMSGDIMKAFGNNVSHVEQIADNYVTVPISSDEILMQIHNLIIPGGHESDLVNFRVTQEEGIIKENFYVLHTTADGTFVYPTLGLDGVNSFVLDSKFDVVTPSEAMTMTRFIPGGAVLGDDDYVGRAQYRIVRSGSEIPTRIVIYTAPSTYDDNGMVQDHTVTISSSYINTSTGFDDLEVVFGLIDTLTALAAFDWAPRLYLLEYDYDGADTVTKVGIPFGEYQNFTVVHQDVIARMNDVAILSELASSSFTSI